MGQPYYPLVHNRPRCWAGFVCLVLTGCCSTPPPPVVKVVDNPEKDKYITRIEHEASEASAALKVAKDGVTPPHSKLVDLTIVRLDGIKPPSQKQVDAFKVTLGNTKELKKAEEKAGKVDEETSALLTLIDMQDIENQSLKEENESIRKEQAFAELRLSCFTLGSWFTIGGGLLLVGASVLGMPKKGGLVMLAIAALLYAAPFIIRDVVDALWFKIGVGVVIVLGGIALLLEAFLHHKEVKGRLTSRGETAT